MGYEDAPSTRMIATHCAVCKRPLRDANSIEVGMGPDCQREYGFHVEIDPLARREANVIIHNIAVQRRMGDLDGIIAMIDRVEALGLVNLAGILRDRLAEVQLIEHPAEEGKAFGRLEVHTPYADAFVQAFRKYIPASDKRMVLNPETAKFDHWEVRAASDVKRGVLRALGEAFAGRIAKGPKGLFVIAPPTSKGA